MDQVDPIFAELVIKERIASRAQVDECIKLVRKATQLGAASNLSDTMVAKGYLSRGQAGALLAKIRPAEMQVTSIAGYELIEKLGGGAMGVVYKARQLSMNRLVAIKVLKPALSLDKAFVERFFREAHTAAKLDHHNIVRAIDAGHDQGYHYFVMEFIDGPTVAERLRHGPMGETEALKIIHQVARALVHAEKYGVVHRDIRPHNIVLTSDGAAKLADLGLAKNLGADGSAAAPGELMGTPYYVSPEQARGDTDLDTRSDIYSLGATLFRMVTGSVPFDGETPASIISKRLAEPIPVARSFRPGLSIATNRLIYRMMAKGRAQRHQTVAELLADIEDAMQETAPRSESHAAPASAARERKPAGWSGKVGLAAGGAIAVAALVAVIWVANRDRTPQPPTVSRAAQAQEALDVATRYRLEHRDDPDGEIRLLEGIAAEYKGTDSAARAVQRLADLRRRKERHATVAQLAALRVRSTDLANAARYGAAVAEVETFAKEHASVFARTEAAKLEREIAGKAARHYADLAGQADAALAQGYYATARAALKPVENFGLAQLEEKMRIKLAEIESREKDATQWARWDRIQTEAAALVEAGKYREAIKLLATAKEIPLPKIAKLVAEQTEIVREAKETAGAAVAAGFTAAFDERVRPLLATRSYEKAEETLKKLGDDIRPTTRLLEDAGKDIARLIVLWKRVEAHAAALEPGQNLGVAGKNVSFRGYSDGIVRYAMGPVEAGVRLTKMRGKDVIALLGPLPLTDDEPVVQLVLFLLYDKDADPERAYGLLAKVEEGPDAQRYRVMAEAAGGYDFGVDERAAEAPFAELKWNAANDPKKALGLVGGFRSKHGHTRFFNEHLTDLAALRASQSVIGKLVSWKEDHYLVVRKRVTWQVAKAQCARLGGHLITITTADEQAFVDKEFVKHFVGQKAPEIWIGATDERVEGRWRWITGENWAYQHWLPREPNDKNKREDHAEITKFGDRIGWNDHETGLPRWFMCEWNKRPLRFTLERLRELISIVAPGILQSGTVDYEMRLGKQASYTRRGVPLHYAMVAILNQAEVPYQWDKSDELMGALAGRVVDVALADISAGEALDRILGPLGLGYSIDADGVILKLGKKQDGVR